MFGKKWSDEDKHKLAGFKNKSHTNETKQKMSEMQKERHKNNPRKGFKLSEETKQKMSKAKHGVKLSEETKQKMRKPKREGFGKKVSELKKGVKLSEKAKQNMRKPKEYKKLNPSLDLSKKICSLDENKNVIKIYDNCIEALKEIGLSKTTSLTKAIKYGTKSNSTYWGYI